jgi:uncharacterized delta-60 repeat protein/uncharacterized repeat protein (TIGR01451 family)
MKNILITMIIVPIISFSQIGILDEEFNSGTGTELSVNTHCSLIQNDGRIIIGGAFMKYNGVNVNRLVRILQNGLIDYSFQPSFGTDAEVLNIKSQNNKIIISGLFSEYNNQTVNGICRLNMDGTLDPTFSSQANFNSGVYATELYNDKIYIGGNIPFYGGVNVNNLVLLNNDGSRDNSFSTGIGFNEKVYTIKKQIDNKIIVAGTFTSYNGVLKNRVLRLNTDGSIDDSFNIGTGANDEIRTIEIQDDGKILLFGKFTSFNNSLCNRLVRLNSDGSIDNTFNSGLGANNWILTSKLMQDGSIMIGGNFTSYNGIYKGRIAKINHDGSLVESFIFNNGFNNIVNSINEIEDNKILITGSFTQFDNIIKRGLVLLNNSNKGVIGNFFIDSDSNCMKDENELPYNNTNFILYPTNELIQINEQGYFYFNHLEPGNYQILYDSVSFWKITCPQNLEFTVIDAEIITMTSNIGMKFVNNCMKPNISIKMPFMRACFTNQKIHVQACNEYDATGVIPDAYSIVKLDPNLIFENASLPFTSLGNNQYRFEHDTLYPGECVNYTISTQVNCAAVLGQTFCMEANLFPIDDCVLDTIPTPPTGEVTPCTLPWDKSSLSVEGWCANDSIYFTITNTGELGGGDMECYSPVRIYVDGIAYILDSIKLLGGEIVTYVFLGTGQTWRLEADQHPLHPGNSHPNAHVENCNPGNWTPGMVTIFPQDDADPVKDIYCGVVTGSYDPNDKRGFPSGLGEDFEILPNQDLEYIIRFQNTGTDTAFTVVVRDTLDVDFDIFSVTPGSASHNYSFRMYGPRVLEWTFPNILLPDSTTNEPLSNGFLSFKVKQKPNLPDGTLLKNDADIYFDFNEPIITNETSHKVQRRTFQATNSLTSLTKSKSTIKLYPNPTKQEATLSFSNYQKQVSFKLLNLSGKVVLEKTNLYGKEVKVNLSEVPNGLYFMEVKTDLGTEMVKVVKE